MRVVGAIVGGVIGAALGAVFWVSVADDPEPSALVMLGLFDAAVGAFIGWAIAGRLMSSGG